MGREYDSRLIGQANVGHEVNPWRKISHLSNGCTGALVGPRHVLTAGHCVMNRGSGSVARPTVRPGRNGFEWPFGESELRQGDLADAWILAPLGWTDDASRAVQYDVALIILPDRLGEAVSDGGTELGWMGWWYEGAAQSVNPTRFNRGYPSCDSKLSDGTPRTDDPADPDAPEGTTSELSECHPQHLYGDRIPCRYGDYHARTPEGWYRNVKHSCDASAGHSGSPIYFYGDGQVGRPGSVYVSGMDIQSLCGGWSGQAPCEADTVLQDRALRLTPEYAAMIHAVRLMWP